MDKHPPGVGHTVRARLVKLARERSEDIQLLLTRYANERFLYRLANSEHGRQFVLKGAALFTVWTGHPHRATRDLDLLGFGELDEARVRDVFTEVLTLDVEDDGIHFDLNSLAVAPIRDQQEYGGIRVEVVARMTTARLHLQIDVGFGDAITPEASVVEFPPLLNFPAPRLRAYPRETVIAEKLEAMAQLGIANSRMKDFYDIAVLARDYDFESNLLARAIRATFERRKTPLSGTLPVALTPVFAADSAKRSQWSGFVRKAGVRDASDLGSTIAKLASFLEFPLTLATTGASSSLHWHAGGPWRT